MQSTLARITAMALWLALVAPVIPAAPRNAEDGLKAQGLAVVLGLPESSGAEWVTRKAAESGLTIYFQSPKPEEVLAVRKAAQAAGMLGNRIFADQAPWTHVNMADNLADEVWVMSRDAQDQAPPAELLRVLHPEGKALVGAKEIVKPFPAGIDDWSHPFHGPDNNPQSTDQLARMPYLTQFLVDPLFSPMPEVTVAAGGRLFKAMGHISHKVNQNIMLNTLLGINGYNGTILWQRPLREGFVIHRNTMIATPEVLYLADDESCKLIDARTGELKDQIVVPAGTADGKVWKWMALDAGKARLCALVGGEEVQPKTVRSQVQGLGHWPWSMWEGHDYKNPKTNFEFGRTFMAVDVRTKKIRWTHSEQEYIDGRGVCMKGDRIYYYCPGKFLACLDAKTGQVVWKADDPDLLKAIGPTGPAQNPREGYATSSFIKCNDQYVFFAGPQRPNLVVVSARDGKLVWSRKDGNLHLILRDDAFYAVGGSGGALLSASGAKIAYGTWQTLAELPRRRSCTRATASVDSIFYRAAEGTMQIRLADDHAQHLAPMRPPCQDGVVIANGMLYWGPWMCGCPLSLYGHLALAPAGDSTKAAAEAEAWEPGEGDPQTVEKLPLEAGDWPSLRHDNQRSSAIRVGLPEKIARQWTFTPPMASRPTAPATAGGLVFVGDDSGVLRALDGARGTVRWQAYTAGAIFMAPAVWEGRVFVGAADGRVYAFEAATGRKLWSVRVAPAQRWIPVLGRLMSTWPVAGGVVVEDGVVYAAAGMANYDGTYVLALDAATGKVKWRNDGSGVLSPEVKNGISLQGELYLKNGALCFAGGTVYQTARYDLKTGMCLNQPVSTLGSVNGNAFYPYYPDYGQFVPLKHALADGRTLSYEVIYEGSRQWPLVMLPPRRPGEQEALPPWNLPLRDSIRSASQRKPLWARPVSEKFNAFVVANNQLAALGQNASAQGTEFFLAGIGLNDGKDIWRKKLPVVAVKDGLAMTNVGQLVVALADGRVMGFGGGRD